MARIIFLILTLVCYFTPFASAQEAYPTKPIEVLIGVPPGSWSDTSTRMLAPFVEKQLGTKLIVVNKPGASGSLAAKQVVQANPDGYTLFCVNHQFIIFGAISESAPYSAQDFEPIGKMATAEGVIFVKSDSPWKTFDEVIEYARKNPRKLRVATSGLISMGNIVFNLLNRKAKIEYIHMDFPGGEPEGLTSILGGHADICYTSLGIAAPHLKAGRLRALVAPNRERSPLMPDVPTLYELGYPKPADGFAFNGMVAPQKIPRDRIAKLCKAFEKAIIEPELNTNLNKIGLSRDYLPPEEFQKFLVDTWRDVKKIASEAQIKLK